MTSNFRFAMCVSLLWLMPVATSHAHFLWLVPQKDNRSTVALYFSEGPEADNPKLLQKLAGLKVDAYSSDDQSESVGFEFSSDGNTLSATHQGANAWRLKHTYGVHGRDVKNLIVYTAISVACGWPGMAESDRVQMPQEGFTAEPIIDGNHLTIRLTRDGKPAGGIEVELQSPNDHQTLVSNAEGVVDANDIQPGVYALRCVETDATPGTHDGTPYASVMHYTTISFRVPKLSHAVVENTEASTIGELPEAITSFGATVAGSHLYAYGGHTGGAHSYSNEAQFNRLVRLDPNGSKQWETIAEGPRVQGNALLNFNEDVILVGGFCAENKSGEKARLVSQSECIRFELQSKKWVELPSLPEPRSSMDATILGDDLYVVGGWTMSGDGSETKWLETAWRFPVGAKSGDQNWTPIAAPPFQRRAMAVTAHDGKIFVIGGMDSDGSPTTACNVYDPKHDQWSTIDSIAGVPLNGFGAAAADIGGKLLVTTVDGSIQKWNEETMTWDIVGHVPTGRFFHRMLPLSTDSFVLLGGANMGVGKFRESLVVTMKP